MTKMKMSKELGRLKNLYRDQISRMHWDTQNALGQEKAGKEHRCLQSHSARSEVRVWETKRAQGIRTWESSHIPWSSAAYHSELFGEINEVIYGDHLK